MTHPRLTFFLELPAAEVTALLARPGVLAQLTACRAAIAMALLDLDPQRAQAIRLLTAHQIPVTAWLVLETGEGYWLTADKAHCAKRRYAEVHAWARAEQLTFAGVGLDIEVPHSAAAPLFDQPLRALGRLLRHSRPEHRVRQARAEYEELIQQIRQDGYRTETYHLPFIHDEREAGSSLLQRALGIVDVRADREVLMLYRSVLAPPFGELLVDAYGGRAAAIAVGITGGGVAVLQPAFEARLLDLPALLADLRRARRYTEHLYVFSLEGCVESGLLEPLSRADLTAPHDPPRLQRLGQVARAGLRSLLTVETWLQRATLRRRLHRGAEPSGQPPCHL